MVSLEHPAPAAPNAGIARLPGGGAAPCPFAIVRGQFATVVLLDASPRARSTPAAIPAEDQMRPLRTKIRSRSTSHQGVTLPHPVPVVPVGGRLAAIQQPRVAEYENCPGKWTRCGGCERSSPSGTPRHGGHAAVCPSRHPEAAYRNRRPPKACRSLPAQKEPRTDAPSAAEEPAGHTDAFGLLAGHLEYGQGSEAKDLEVGINNQAYVPHARLLRSKRLTSNQPAKWGGFYPTSSRIVRIGGYFVLLNRPLEG